MAGEAVSELCDQHPRAEASMPEMREQRQQPLDRRQAAQVNVTIQGQFSDFAPDLLQVIEKVPKDSMIDKFLMLTRDSC
ncbi:hypothetical protein HFO32_22035 [Rhizobium leguminosarum]|uniref:hypothetical protein n=1 Tax=Rhizobium leguminosarum TaxID=384 RepID=UPI001C982846|nr:hypothetical protein [Rhizobium leguminosarum]MBY5684805.1 hypothetical protein [Rhizobium leguminosarum]